MSWLLRFLRALLPWQGAVVLGVWLGLGFAGLGLWRELRGERRIAFLDDVEEALFNLKFKVRGPLRAGSEVAVAVIDERSMARFGRWPWPREVFARLVRRLQEYGVKTVAFDVIFDKPERTPWRDEAAALWRALADPGGGGLGPRQRPEWLRRLATQAPDVEFATAIREAGNVILGFFLFENEVDSRGVPEDELERALQLVLPAARDPKEFEGRERAELNQAKGVRAPIEVLAQAARRRMAYFNTPADAAGKTLYARLATAVGGHIFCHLSLLAVAEFRDTMPIVDIQNPQAPPRIVVEDTEVPSEMYGRFYPNFYGPRNTFKHFSVADIMEGAVPKERLAGKLVFVGATAIALYDTWSTPFDKSMPGVEIHATTADNILTRRFLSRPDWLTVFELCMLFALGPLVGFAVGRQSRVLGLLLGLFALGATALGDVWLFQEGFLVRSSLFYFEIMVVALLCYVLLYFLVYKERKRLRNTMQHYLAPSVLAEMLRDQSKLKLGGEKRELTVLFSDIRGFTTLSEAFDAPDLVAFLNEYFSPMTEIVLQNLGTFDKYIGDALMAYFGAPQEQPDHAVRACRACLEMREKLGELNLRWKGRGLPNIGIGIGLSTGPSAFGNMGSTKLFNYTVIGDNVNIASRVEGASKLFGAVIVVAESTAKAAAGEFIFRRLGATFVAGKGEAQSLYELVERAPRRAELQPWLDAYEAGVGAWDARELAVAEGHFRRALALHPSDVTSERYLGRIADARAEGSWETVWRASK